MNVLRHVRLGLMIALCLVFACDGVDGHEVATSGSGGPGGGADVDAASTGSDAGGAEPDADVNARQPTPPGGRVVRVDDTGSTVGTGFTECASHADCALANDGCALCCQQIAVRRDLLGEYEQVRADACDAAGLGPAPCDCAFSDLVPRCEAGQCAAVPRDELADICDSPARPEGAHEPGSAACHCALEGQQTCVGGAAHRSGAAAVAG
ncbi:MAG: hypothetical protein PVI30_13075 [Myxococcales bacterium]|jgi:hypothetical protein